MLDVDGDGALAPLTDGLLLLRYLFGFSGATLTTGALGGGLHALHRDRDRELHRHASW